MSVAVKVLEPVDGETLKVELTCEAGYEMIRCDLDMKYHRFVVVFCQSGTSKSETKEVIETPWIQNNNYAFEHSLSAIAVVNNKVVNSDRRMVRDGKTEK